MTVMQRRIIGIIAAIIIVICIYYILRILDNSGASDLLSLNAINSPKELGRRMDVLVFLFAFFSLASAEFLSILVYFIKFITGVPDANHPGLNIRGISFVFFLGMLSSVMYALAVAWGVA